MVRRSRRRAFQSVSNSSHSLRPEPDGNGYYSLQQEALNTEKHDTDWFVQSQLRSQHLLFVSAGSYAATESAGSHATTDSFTSPFATQEPPGLQNSKTNASLVEFHDNVATEHVVSKSLMNLDLSKRRTTSSANPSAPSPTSSSISSSDEILFLGKDPMARQDVTPDTAGWDLAGVTTGLTTTIKSSIKDPKDNDDDDDDDDDGDESVDNESDDHGSDADEAIIRDYVENVGGFDSLRDGLDGGSGQFGFLSRPLDIGEESGLEELHRSTYDNAYRKNERFAGPSIMFEKSDYNDVDGNLGEEDESVEPAAMHGTSANTGTALSQSLIDLVDGPDGNFDITDRSSLGLQLRQKKGAIALRGCLPDAQFSNSMDEALSTDRQKKMARRKERETLRKQGLLGNSKPDLKAKYEEGMNLGQIKQEFIQFCSSTHENQSFPPMGKEERKIVHELAAAFGLKSKSAGSGKARYATLVKTRRSRAFDEITWARVEQRIRRKYFPRLDNGGRGNVKGQPRSAFGSGDASVRYIEGDVVGGTAPEIAASNRGRGMLEKMGWSSGMALGSSNNGILQPIQHIVRNSRAGLG